MDSKAKFIHDCVELFGLKILTAQELERFIIEKMDLKEEEFFDAISDFERLHGKIGTSTTLISLFISNTNSGDSSRGRKKKEFNTLMFTCFFYYIFNKKRLNEEYTTEIATTLTTFHRIIFDFDIKSSSFDDDDLIEKVVAFVATTTGINGDYVKTIRRNRVNKNFHLIFNTQVDVQTYSRLFEAVDLEFGKGSVTIDKTSNWYLPTGRCHTSGENESYNDFKLFSPLDVWNMDNFNCSLVSESDFETNSFITFKNKHETFKWYAHIGKLEKFFYKFIFYGDYTVSFCENYTKEFKDLYSLVPSKLSIGVDIFDGQQNDLTSIEFYEAIHESEIIYQKSVNDIFKEERVEETSMEIDVDLNNLLVNSKKDDVATFLKRETILNWTPRMRIYKEQQFEVYDRTWTGIISKMLLYINDELFLPAFLIVFKRYTGIHRVVLERPIYEYLEVINEEARVPSASDVELVSIFKLAFSIMMNEMCITSLLAFLLNCDIYKENLVLSCVFLLNTLDISEKARFVLYKYISEDFEPHLSGLYQALIKSFYNNDLIYFFAELYDEPASEKYNKFKSFFKPMSNNAAPLPPKRRREVEEPWKYDRIYHKYIIFSCYNGALYLYFDQGRYKLENKIPEFLNQNKSFLTCLELEPMKLAYWYRRSIGIYYSITQMIEMNTPSLVTLVYTPTASIFNHYGLSIYDNHNYELKSFILDMLLKTKHFIEIMNLNQTVILLLAPTTDEKSLNYPTLLSNIVPMDLNKRLNLPASFVHKLCEYQHLQKAVRYLSLIICQLSDKCFIDLKNPAAFIEQTFLKINVASENDEQVLVDDDNFVDIQQLKTIGNNALVFFKLLNKSSQGALEIENPDVDEQTSYLTINTFQQNLNELNNFMIRYVFNKRLLDEIEFDINAFPIEFFDFILSVLSWYLRGFEEHDLMNTEFFVYLNQNRTQIYTDLDNLLKVFYGHLMINNSISSMATYFKNFCKNTLISIPDKYTTLCPFGYKLNVNDSGIFENELYTAIVGLIFQSQVSLDTFVDMLKVITSYTHRGNIFRKFMALLKRTHSGKNSFINSLITNIFPSDTLSFRQQFTDNDLQTCLKDRGNFLAAHLSANLLTWFDEVTVIPDHLKSLVNCGVVNFRELYASSYSEFKLNTSIIMSANNAPKGRDVAANLRMIPIDRFYQYAELQEGHVIKRLNSLIDPTIGPVNEYLGIQLLVERFPSTGESNINSIGSYIMYWQLSDLFFLNFVQPISKKLSKTFGNRLLEFLYIAQPHIYVLKSNIFKFSSLNPMDIALFDQKILDFLKMNKTLFENNLVSTNALKELKDMVGQYIDPVENKIYVEFCK